MEDSKSKIHLLILVGLILATRIPFLFDGYGHEEDSYGLVVNAWAMHHKGYYMASRFPGHPFQEYVYSFIWNQPDWIWNSLSLFFSVIAVIAFYKALRKTGMNLAFEASLMLAFTPMFFNAGTYSIDYTWSLAFVLLSFWALVNRNFWWCGIFLGMAVGCRITSGVFMIPWAMLLFQRMDFAQWRTWIIKILVPFSVIGFLWYVPAMMQYGTSFFAYSDQFPYPPITKVIYKTTIGVFGILGLLGLGIVKFQWLMSKKKVAENPPALFSPQRLTWVILMIIVLHLISYLRLPQKAGYMLPIVPFAIMLIVMYGKMKTVRIATIVYVLAPFLLGMNITDELRGSGTSAASMRFTVSGQEISIDALRGPALAEKEKRRNKNEYTNAVCDSMLQLPEDQTVICGWWFNEIFVNFIRQGRVDIQTTPESMAEANVTGGTSAIKIFFYLNCAQIEERRTSGDMPGGKIYYLPEQNIYNDQMFGQECTDEIAEPFPIK